MPSLADRCSRPLTVTATSSNSSNGTVLSTTFKKACGTRLSSLCQSCSRIYCGDLRHLVRSGLDKKRLGGRNVATFLTFTAPGSDVFGATHSRLEKVSTNGKPYVQRCACGATHRRGDDCLGSAVNPSTYNYDAAALFNASSSRLLTITLQKIARLMGEENLARVRVAEFQQRGLIHFHVLILGDVPKKIVEAVVKGGRLTYISDTEQGPKVKTRLIRKAQHNGVVWGEQFDVQTILAESQAKLERYISKLVSYAVKSVGTDERGAYQHERAMRQAGLRSCPCNRPHGPIATSESNVADFAERQHNRWRCRRQRSATRNWGFRGHVFAASRSWGATLQEIRERRRNFAAHLQPSVPVGSEWTTTWEVQIAPARS